VLRKRSFAIARHRTSVALEEEFWRVLEIEAHREGISLSAFVAAIDLDRGGHSLASALRLRALASAARER
jgi:predicted DNA-binding ribbon-helix-helix protein